MGYETVHIMLNNVAFAEDLVELRAQGELQKQIEALPGKAPTIKL